MDGKTEEFLFEGFSLAIIWHDIGGPFKIALVWFGFFFFFQGSGRNKKTLLSKVGLYCGCNNFLEQYQQH